MSSVSFGPATETAIVSRRGASRVLGPHPWVYESDIAKRPSGPAGLVKVEDKSGRQLGTALHSPASVIALRMVQKGRGSFTAETVKERVRDALARRERQLPGADAFRWIHGEADFLPSIFVDCYGDVASVQSLSGGGDVLLPQVIEEIQAVRKLRAVVVRNDSSTRRRESLEQYVRVIGGEEPVHAVYREGDVPFEIELTGGQKTGSFLDQTYNHLVARKYARGLGVDICTYQGGFALQLASGGCETVWGVDASGPALAHASEHAARAGISNVRWVQSDAMDWLRQATERGDQFDTVCVDPPAFASGKHTVKNALNAYTELNRLAMQVTKPGGILISCSCSGRVTAVDFEQILIRAARKAGRDIQILERRGAGPDHPVLLGVPETEYLKCRVVAVI